MVKSETRWDLHLNSETETYLFFLNLSPRHHEPKIWALDYQSARGCDSLWSRNPRASPLPHSVYYKLFLEKLEQVSLVLKLCDCWSISTTLVSHYSGHLNEKSYFWHINVMFTWDLVNVLKELLLIRPHFRSELAHKMEKLGTQEIYITAERKTNKKFQTNRKYM